jgi:hypothetical protein
MDTLSVMSLIEKERDRLQKRSGTAECKAEELWRDVASYDFATGATQTNEEDAKLERLSAKARKADNAAEKFKTRAELLTKAVLALEEEATVAGRNIYAV